jgi:hypothetical protein
MLSRYRIGGFREGGGTIVSRASCYCFAVFDVQIVFYAFEVTSLNFRPYLAPRFVLIF